MVGSEILALYEESEVVHHIYRVHSGWAEYGVAGFPIDDIVIHWMPVPDPPEDC